MSPLTCPFCGSPNVTADHTVCEPAVEGGMYGLQAGCDDCGATGPKAADDTEAGAIKAWNRSVPRQYSSEDK